MSTCTNSVTINHCPGEFNWACLRVGFTYVHTLTFPVDVNTDGFTAVIKDADGATVDTLTIGSGIDYTSDPKKITVKIGTPVTDNAGLYTWLLSWQRVSTGENVPIVEGEVEVN